MKGYMPYALLGIAIVFSIFARMYDNFPGDTSIISFVQDRQNSLATDFMEAFSLLGDAWVMYLLIGVTTLVLFLLNRKRECFFAIGTFIIMNFSPLLKWLVDRPRPPAEIYSLGNSFDSLSFPSGHAYHSFVLFGFLFFLATVFIQRTRTRRFIQVLLLFTILTIGISRIYLGAHWPSDVMGAYLLGGSFLWLMLRFYLSKIPVNKSC